MDNSIKTAEWRRVRLAVLQRDLWTCNYCGQEAQEVDHVIPRASGGTNEEDNLVAACRRCNRSKGKGLKPRSGRFFVGPLRHPPAGGDFSPMTRIGPENAI
jgi:5-methylcytosine-specific restriction endonuclease McrA